MLEELDIKDDHGNVLIQPGLKVRHKESQYEYTVDDVVEDPDGEIVVMLNMPEEPRFDPPDPTDDVILDAKIQSKQLYEVNPDPSDYVVLGDEEQPHPSEEEFLAISKDEFEKDYEVK